MAPQDFMDDEISLMSAVELSAIYGEAADELRLAIQKPGITRDQMAQLVILASRQLDAASNAIDRLARTAERKKMGVKDMAPNEQSARAGLWEHQAQDSIRRARLQGFMMGAGTVLFSLAAFGIVFS